MDKTKQFKHIVGECTPGSEATIRLFKDINEYSAASFCSEFLYLQDYIKPSSINIHINSQGGSVMHGMSVFSVIRGCDIPTTCIIEGIAASVASIIWAAGDVSKMRDYSILMIHNPFSATKTKGVQDMILAFKKQIETIYIKRWGMAEDVVRAIMDGEVGKDGTFFDAKGAVEAGIILESCVLTTNKQALQDVKNSITNNQDEESIQEAFETVINQLTEKNKPLSEETPNLKVEVENQIQHTNQTKTQKQMNETNEIQFHFGAVSASLGMQGKPEVADVMNRITELVSVEAKLADAQRTITELNIGKAGAEETVKNIQNELADVKNQLQVYKEAEEQAKKAEIASVIENAIKEGRIEREKAETWTNMAHQDLSLVKDTLAGIPAREKISQSISEDASNVQNTINGVETEEAKLAAKVEASLGGKVQFHRFEDQ
ncbi:MAG: ATP-dependent Clp protease proteolytic subunit [Bacteroidales bacterium]